MKAGLGLTALFLFQKIISASHSSLKSEDHVDIKVTEEEVILQFNSYTSTLVPPLKNPSLANTNQLLEKRIQEIEDVLVITKEGPIRGAMTASNQVRMFLGVPYAGAPIGGYRWSRAPPLRKRSRLFDATHYGHHCYQVSLAKPSAMRDLFLKLPSTVSEDCLNVNIFAPAKGRILVEARDSEEEPIRRIKPVPVLFFVHGGCLSNGSNGAPLLDPRDLVKELDVIVVEPNYRLNLFGFLAVKDKDSNPIPVTSLDEALTKARGNYGLVDLIDALIWTKRNIRAFGGDPENITLMGQSAGAILASYMQVILGRFPQEPPLFHRIVLGSGSLMTSHVRVPGVGDKRVEPVWNRTLEMTGCTNINCLRLIEPASLNLIANEQGWELIWMPLLDGVLLTDVPVDLVNSAHQVPALVSSCLHDGTVFSMEFGEMRTKEDFVEVLQKQFGPDQAFKLAGLYDPEQFYASGTTVLMSRTGDKYYWALTAIFTDALFKCPIMEYAARVMPLLPSTYYVLFTERLWLADWLQWMGMIKDPGVFHGSELLILFNSLGYLTVGHGQSISNLRTMFYHFMQTGELDTVISRQLCQEGNLIKLTKSELLDPKCSYWTSWNPFAPKLDEPKRIPIAILDNKGDGKETGVIGGILHPLPI